MKAQIFLLSLCIGIQFLLPLSSAAEIQSAYFIDDFSSPVNEANRVPFAWSKPGNGWIQKDGCLQCRIENENISGLTANPPSGIMQSVFANTWSFEIGFRYLSGDASANLAVVSIFYLVYPAQGDSGGRHLIVIQYDDKNKTLKLVNGSGSEQFSGIDLTGKFHAVRILSDEGKLSLYINGETILDGAALGIRQLNTKYALKIGPASAGQNVSAHYEFDYISFTGRPAAPDDSSWKPEGSAVLHLPKKPEYLKKDNEAEVSAAILNNDINPLKSTVVFSGHSETVALDYSHRSLFIKLSALSFVTEIWLIDDCLDSFGTINNLSSETLDMYFSIDGIKWEKYNSKTVWTAEYNTYNNMFEIIRISKLQMPCRFIKFHYNKDTKNYDFGGNLNKMTKVFTDASKPVIETKIRLSPSKPYFIYPEKPSIHAFVDTQKDNRKNLDVSVSWLAAGKKSASQMNTKSESEVIPFNGKIVPGKITAVVSAYDRSINSITATESITIIVSDQLSESGNEKHQINENSQILTNIQKWITEGTGSSVLVRLNDLSGAQQAVKLQGQCIVSIPFNFPPAALYKGLFTNTAFEEHLIGYFSGGEKIPVVLTDETVTHFRAEIINSAEAVKFTPLSGIHPAHKEMDISLLSMRILNQNSISTSPHGGSYLNKTGLVMIGKDWYSENNGLTSQPRITTPDYAAGLPYGYRRSPLPLFADVDEKKILYIVHSMDVPDVDPNKNEPHEQLQNLYLRYRVSSDEGKRFLFEKVIHQTNRTPENPFDGVHIGKNALFLGDIGSKPIKTRRGEILIPAQATFAGSDGKLDVKGKAHTWTRAVILIGKWNKDGTILWITSGSIEMDDPMLSTRGVIEPTLAEMPDGRILCIMRGSNGGGLDPDNKIPSYRWFSVSTDGGRTWTKPAPWKYRNGETFFSPSSMSVLIPRPDGRVFWAGNITPVNPRGNLPRNPLCLGEVDSRTLQLKKETLLIVDDCRPEEQEVFLSHFWGYTDRIGQDIIITLPRYGSGYSGGPFVQYTVRVK